MLAITYSEIYIVLIGFNMKPLLTKYCLHLERERERERETKLYQKPTYIS